MHKPRPSEVCTIFCLQNTSKFMFCIFPQKYTTSFKHNLKDFFFDVFIFFCDFLNTKKMIHKGGVGEKIKFLWRQNCHFLWRMGAPCATEMWQFCGARAPVRYINY